MDFSAMASSSSTSNIHLSSSPFSSSSSLSSRPTTSNRPSSRHPHNSTTSKSSTRRQRTTKTATLLLSLSLSLLPSVVTASSQASSSLPQIDFNKMGTVGLAGSFAGLDFFDPSSPSGSGSGSALPGSGSQVTINGSSPVFSTTADSLVLRRNDGSGTVLGNVNQGGKIWASCYYPSTSSSSNGTIYFGGGFTSFAGVAASNVGSYDLSTGSFNALNGGVEGTVKSIYCDPSGGRIWIGGDLTGPKTTTTSTTTNSSSFTGGVIIYTPTTSSFSPPPFTGLNGSVSSITPSSNSSSLYFSGQFTTTFLTTQNQTLNTTGLSPVNASIISAPVGTVTTSTSGYLTPIALSNSTIEAIPDTITQAGEFGDPSVLSCPTVGQGWAVQDGIQGKVTLMVGGNGAVEVAGVRLGNLLDGGKGTTGFSLTTLPDNTVQTLTYTDPATGVTATCKDSCPLSTLSSVTAQDFLFSNSQTSLTGVQLILQTWQGSGAGLSRLQLLSSGGFATAVIEEDGAVCGLNGTTKIDFAGGWSIRTVTTDIPGTTLHVKGVDVDTTSTDRPSLTFYPFVASSGYYQVYMIVPGCVQMQDCDSRTDVKIDVFPFDGGLPASATISEKVDQDTPVLVYDGWVQASNADSFQMTIVLTLVANPPQPASGSSWEVVAGQVQMVLSAIGLRGNGNGPSTNGTIINGTSLTNVQVPQLGFGIFEWPLNRANVNAAQTLTNATETPVDKLGFTLSSAIGANLTAVQEKASGFVVSAVAPLDNMVYVGGNFSSPGNWSNVLSVNTASGVVTPLPNGGLNGQVHAAAAVGSYIYFGGNFTGTSATGGPGMAYVGRYDPSSKSWSALAGGLDGPVSQIIAGSGNNSLLISGNFTNALGSDGSTLSIGGFAIWNLTSSGGGSWDTSSGRVFGNVAQATLGGQDVYLAGGIAGMSSTGVQGIAYLSGSGSDVKISSLPLGFSAAGSDTTSPSAATTSTPATRRSNHRQPAAPTKKGLAALPRVLINRLSSAILGKRQSTGTAANPPPLPRITSIAPAVLAGSFWTNSSASGSPQITILGGNFTKPAINGSSAIEGISFYNSGSGSMSGIKGEQVSGVVRALAVVEDTLYIGGDMTVGGMQGLTVYNLKQGQWVASGIPSLRASSGNASVHAIRQRGDTSTVIVAGNFSTAGSLNCVGICQWDTSSTQWSALGSGLQVGEIRAIDFAGSTLNSLIAAGSFSLSGGVLAYVAQYSFDNNTWAALGTAGTGTGQIPGPATAVAVDSANATNIFASGLSSVDQSPYLLRWDGTQWTTQNSTLRPGSQVQQLVFVPLSKEHTASGSIERNRMLMISGALETDSGNSTVSLYDGQTYYPYLNSLSSTGTPGSASSLFYSTQSWSWSTKTFLAVGIIVLIAIAISTGLVFLFVLIGLLVTRCNRDKDDSTVFFATPTDDNSSDSGSQHKRRLNAIQRALAPVVGGAAVAGAATSVSEKHHSASTDGSFLAGGAAQRPSDETMDSAPTMMGRPTTAKYDFVGENEAELTVQVGEELFVVDESPEEMWSLCRNREGKVGVVPSSYIY